MSNQKELERLFFLNPLKGLRHAHDMYADKLLFLSMRYLNNKMEAEEAVSDTFLKAYDRMDTFDWQLGTSFYGWISRICVNVCLMRLRKKGFKIVELEDMPQEVYIEDVVSLDYDTILKSIQSLGVPYSTIFFMYEIDGYPHQEISEILKIPVGTSKSYLHRAKKQLQKIWQTI